MGWKPIETVPEKKEVLLSPPEQLVALVYAAFNLGMDYQSGSWPDSVDGVLREWVEKFWSGEFPTK